MEKNTKDYLHLYLGCEAYWQEEGYKSTYSRPIDFDMLRDADWIKPILRPLSSMTEEEGNELEMMGHNAVVNKFEINQFHAARTRYLLSKGFDLFGLIEAGLAIEKK